MFCISKAAQYVLTTYINQARRLFRSQVATKESGEAIA